MPGIWNINSINNTDAKRLSRKLSFEVGEKILAKVVNLDKTTGDILLKLLDGWQFPAKLEKSLETFPEGLLRFEVEGFEEGKIKLKLVEADNKKEISEGDSISNLLKESNIDVNKDDYKLLGKMIKHDIPLTKENISRVKTITDFMNKIKQDENEAETFISKYVQSKNIDVNSENGDQIRNKLKSFFNELKGLNDDDVLTIIENNIDLTEDNIRSFNNVFKESKSIYSSIKDISEEALRNPTMNDDNVLSGGIEPKGLINETDDELRSEKSDIIGENSNRAKLNSSEKSNQITNNSEEKHLEGKSINTKEDLEIKDLNIEENLEEKGRSNEKLDVSDDDKNKKTPNNDLDKSSDETKLVDNTVGKDKISDGLQKDKSVSNLRENSIDDITKIVKNEIHSKTEEIKMIIKTILDQSTDKNSSIYNKVVETLQNNINDFKIYNMVSNQYYYLDLPINVGRHEYQCKLMIKDERKKGKKIDTTNVKIAASVNTEHMGTVDAYIKLNNSIMEIDIKSDKQWTKLLDIGKNKILEDTSNIGYNVYVKVSEKEKEMNIVNCREFFEDNNLGMIDRKV